MTEVIGPQPLPRNTPEGLIHGMTEDAMKKVSGVILAAALIGVAIIAGCSRSMRSSQGQLLDIAQSRNLSPEDAAHALKTFVPPGGRDEFLLFASGGHSGQVHVIGVQI